MRGSGAVRAAPRRQDGAIPVNIGQWFINKYDLYVESVGGAVPLEQTREALDEAYRAAVNAGEITRAVVTMRDESRQMTREHIEPLRNRRRTALFNDGLLFVAVIEGETLLGDDDPYLGLAYPLGDGTDKTLRYWTAEDWESSVLERYRNAAAVTDAARRYDVELASKMVAALRAAGVRTTGEIPALAASNRITTSP